ncbi:MAG TPA: hypothetical protein VLG69_00880 [Candidatus Andersenbacteria bacterium]|nr:hypothetical protein [Candidatus Andersenbacteria bacterium]
MILELGLGLGLLLSTVVTVFFLFSVVSFAFKDKLSTEGKINLLLRLCVIIGALLSVNHGILVNRLGLLEKKLEEQKEVIQRIKLLQ